MGMHCCATLHGSCGVPVVLGYGLIV